MSTFCPRLSARHHVNLVSLSWCPPSCQPCVLVLVPPSSPPCVSYLGARRHVNLVSTWCSPYCLPSCRYCVLALVPTIMLIVYPHLFFPPWYHAWVPVFVPSILSTWCPRTYHYVYLLSPPRSRHHVHLASPFKCPPSCSPCTIANNHVHFVSPTYCHSHPYWHSQFTITALLSYPPSI